MNLPHIRNGSTHTPFTSLDSHSDHPLQPSASQQPPPVTPHPLGPSVSTSPEQQPAGTASHNPIDLNLPTNSYITPSNTLEVLPPNTSGGSADASAGGSAGINGGDRYVSPAGKYQTAPALPDWEEAYQEQRRERWGRKVAEDLKGWRGGHGPIRSNYAHTAPDLPDASYFGQPVTGTIGVHLPKEVLRVERDWTGGEVCQCVCVPSFSFRVDVWLCTVLYGTCGADRLASLIFGTNDAVGRFKTELPVELEDRVRTSSLASDASTRQPGFAPASRLADRQISPDQWHAFIHDLNMRVAAAYSVRGAVIDNILAIATWWTSLLWRTSHFERGLQDAESAIQRANAEVFEKHGLWVKSPREVALQFLEIEYY